VEQAMKIGVFGGSFDPIHIGHLILARRVLEEIALDRVLFVPTNITPHKRDRSLTDPRHRLAMVRLALRGESKMAAGDVEVRRGGVSYTIDTLRALRRKTSARWYLILGSDSLVELPQWHQIEGLARLVTFAVVARPNFTRTRMPMRRCRVRVVAAPLLEISGTDIRRRIREGRPVRYLVPPAVERYILRHRLYRK
jgi:nicotinate-nucleotide adenylyltransferase